MWRKDLEPHRIRTDPRSLDKLERRIENERRGRYRSPGHPANHTLLAALLTIRALADERLTEEEAAEVCGHCLYVSAYNDEDLLAACASCPINKKGGIHKHDRKAKGKGGRAAGRR